jgi:hypothetical protein
MRLSIVAGMALFVVGISVAAFAPGCTTDSGVCSCPAAFTGPGWCPVEGPAPCHCYENVLCARWCLDKGANAPAPCDGGAEE